jgi:hypothetical protein
MVCSPSLVSVSIWRIVDVTQTATTVNGFTVGTGNSAPNVDITDQTSNGGNFVDNSAMATTGNQRNGNGDHAAWVNHQPRQRNHHGDGCGEWRPGPQQAAPRQEPPAWPHWVGVASSPQGDTLHSPRSSAAAARKTPKLHQTLSCAM